jgi:transposase-like protein
LIDGPWKGSSGEPAKPFFGEQLMSTKQPTKIPIALSEARRQLDHWRSQQPNKRTRLPKEFWQQAVALAQEHGLNKTARALKVKYDSLKKHLERGGADQGHSAKPQAEFIELLPATVKPGTVECMLEWADGCGATVRMHIRGAGPSELSAVAGVFRSGRR